MSGNSACERHPASHGHQVVKTEPTVTWRSSGQMKTDQHAGFEHVVHSIQNSIDLMQLEDYIFDFQSLNDLFLGPLSGLSKIQQRISPYADLFLAATDSLLSCQSANPAKFSCQQCLLMHMWTPLLRRDQYHNLGGNVEITALGLRLYGMCHDCLPGDRFFFLFYLATMIHIFTSLIQTYKGWRQRKMVIITGWTFQTTT